VLQAYAVANHYSIVMLGPEGARITDGYSEWEAVSIPRERAVTEFRHRRPYVQTIDALIDGWIVHLLRPNLPRSFINPPRLPKGFNYSRRGFPTGGGGVWIEGMIANLESLAIRQPGDATPHRVRLYGAIWHPECSWAITNLEWGDYIIDGQTGRKMRQQVTIHLLEFNQPTELRSLPRGKAR